MAYRTAFYEAASLLAKISPVHLYAAYLKRVYLKLHERKESGTYTEDSPAEERAEEWLELRRQWAIHIDDDRLPGRRTRGAISPNFESWLDRRTGFLTFRITQFLTGHGCFGTFLFRIGKKVTPICRYCNLAEDSSEHTIVTCNYWGLERGELAAVVGQDLSLAAVVGRMCNSREAWSAFSTFAERILRRKEEDERRRQQGIEDPKIIVGDAAVARGDDLPP
ncbi:uncharacterized protein [Temnothorax longispinosus]|uniref:uncharacterized protein n=1 Tax=Temnothorax longispinosus TaxID=300112 RepID=UPI003A98FA23